MSGVCSVFSACGSLLTSVGSRYVCCLEFGKLYCGGETILSYYLRKFARFLLDREKYRLSSNVMSVAVYWNELWLGKSPSVASSYRQAAITNVLAGKGWWSYVKKLA